MTTERVVLNFHGECSLDHDNNNGWCVVHESRWPNKVQQWCDRTSQRIDLAEQAVEAYHANLRAKIEALRSRPIASFDGYTGRDALDQVLALLDGSSDE